MKKSNIVKMHKRVDFNVGYLVFIIIIFYIAVSVIMYAARKKTTIYQVSTGSLALNNVYTGIIIRDESLIRSSYSGTINFYLNSGEKADKVSVIYSVDETGHISELLDKYTDTIIMEEELSSLKDILTQYTLTYSGTNFSNLYNVKKNLVSKLSRLHYNVMLNDLDELIEQSGNTTLFHKVNAIKTGIVMFTVDGYENLTEDMIDRTYFENTINKNTNLLDLDIVNSGDVVYRLLNSDIWNIYIPLTEDDEEALADRTKVTIKFTDSNIKCNADFSIIKCNGSIYGKITLGKYMINYADKRYIDIEFTETTKNGLKIPVSAVFDKSFFTIPLRFITESGNFVRVTYNKNGEITYEPVDADIYYSDDTYFYVSMDNFSSGDIIMRADSDEQYIVGTMGELTGVYCVNKGYAVFKRIEIIDKNSEYCIASQGNNYGLKVYDHIVLDYRTVNENELVS